MGHFKKNGWLFMYLFVTLLVGTLTACGSEDILNEDFVWTSDEAPTQLLNVDNNWIFDEKEFISQSKKWNKDKFTSDTVSVDNTTFTIIDNCITIQKRSDSSDYDCVYLSLYNLKTDKGDINKKSYTEYDSVKYSVDLKKITNENYFLEYYHANSNSTKYTSSVYSKYGIELIVSKGKLKFITAPTINQVNNMTQKYGDTNNLLQYKTKDGREMIIYAHGQMTYVYCKSETKGIGVDFVRYKNEKGSCLVEEADTGVVSYDTSELNDGLYYICIYEKNGKEANDNNYTSLVYEEELLKVKVIGGKAALLLPPARESVEEAAKSIDNRSILFNTSNNPEYNISFLISGSYIYMYDMPKDYDYIQLEICDKSNKVVGKTIYSNTKRSVCYDASNLADGDYYIQLFNYNGEGMYVSVFAGSMSPKITVTQGTPLFTEPDTYKTNASKYNPSGEQLDKYLKPETNIESDNKSIIETTNRIIRNCGDDYSKILAIHDWVANNIFYDNSLANSDDKDERMHMASALEVFNGKKGVCAGIASLTAAMSRAAGIPAKKINGYALEDKEMHWIKGLYEGENSNHSWNEVYVNNRWIIIDTTWNMNNTVEDGVIINSDGVHAHCFFDCTLEFFSQSHLYMID